jgi:hypothetical protein
LSPFHEGERELQERTGERETADRNAAVYATALDRRAIPFLAEQRMIAIGTGGDGGNPAASVLFGPEGFVTATDENTVVLDLRAVPRSADELWTNLRASVPIGLLAIDLATRRRYRINGSIAEHWQDGLVVHVREAYPNCPKYIQKRILRELALEDGGASLEGTALGPAERALVAASDTFFLASGHARTGLDVSHRGGPPGFVLVEGDRLRVPDYPGNGMFNTLGNLVVDPRAGLVFLDLDRGTALQVRGRAEIFTGGVDSGQRHWDLRVERWRSFPLGVRARWSAPEPSPFLARVRPAVPSE